MTRLPLAALWLALSACTVGSPLASQIADAPGGIDGTDIDASNGCVKVNPSPGVLHTHIAPVVATNPSNAGEPCVQSGCHLAGATGVDGAGNPAPAWQFAGTVYHADGVTPYAGVHIRIVGSDAQEKILGTDQGGNFYTDVNTLTNPFPGHSFVTQCPAAPTAMSEPLPAVAPTGGATGENCNGCHITGGVDPQAPRITLSP